MVSACLCLRLDPAAFWRLPFRDLDVGLRALMPAAQHPQRNELEELHKRFPDLPTR
ncbi:MAG: phage tail assembly chaperone [Nitratireductor sp.]|nr:phage tail assembly chaperone [Nitratireductor sp.]